MYSQVAAMFHLFLLLLLASASTTNGADMCKGSHCNEDYSSMIQTSWDLSKTLAHVMPKYASFGIDTFKSTKSRTKYYWQLVWRNYISVMSVVTLFFFYCWYTGHKRKDSNKEGKKKREKLEKACGVLQEAESSANEAPVCQDQGLGLGDEASTLNMRLPHGIVSDIAKSYKQQKVIQGFYWPF